MKQSLCSKPIYNAYDTSVPIVVANTTQFLHFVFQLEELYSDLGTLKQKIDHHEELMKVS